MPRPFEFVNLACDVVRASVVDKVVERAIKAGETGATLASRLTRETAESRTISNEANRIEKLKKAGKDANQIAENLDVGALLHLLNIIQSITDKYAPTDAKMIRDAAKELREYRNKAAHQTRKTPVNPDDARNALRCGKVLIEKFNKSSLPEIEKQIQRFEAQGRRSLDSAPSLGKDYQFPKTFDQAHAALLREKQLLIHAIGGAGKTSLARALCDDSTIQSAASFGIFWVACGQQQTSAQLLKKLAEFLELPMDLEEHQIQRELAEIFANQNYLVVIDDAWKTEQVENLLEIAGESTYVLITSRNKGIARDLNIPSCEVGRLERSQSKTLLDAKARKSISKSEPEDVEDLLDQLNDHPLAISLTGPWLKGTSIRNYLKDFSVRLLKADSADGTHASIMACMGLSVEWLNQAERDALGLFINFEEQLVAGTALTALIVGHLDISLAAAQNKLLNLEDKNLIEVSERDGTKHYSMHDFIRETLADRHARLDGRVFANSILNGYRKISDDSPWYEIPDDGYLYNNLISWLVQTDRFADARALFATDHWYRIRLRSTVGVEGFEGFVGDLNMVLAFEADRVWDDRAYTDIGTSEDFARISGFRALLTGAQKVTLSTPEFLAGRVRQGEMTTETAIEQARLHLWSWDRLWLALYLLIFTEDKQDQILEFAEKNLPEAIGSYPKEPAAPGKVKREYERFLKAPNREQQIERWFVTALLAEWFPDLQGQIVESVCMAVSEFKVGQLLVPVWPLLGDDLKSGFEQAILDEAQTLYEKVEDDIRSGSVNKRGARLFFICLHGQFEFDIFIRLGLMTYSKSQTIERLIKESTISDWLIQSLLLVLPSISQHRRRAVIDRILDHIGGWAVPDSEELEIGICVLLVPFMDREFLRAHLDKYVPNYEWTNWFAMLLAHESTAVGNYRAGRLARLLIGLIEDDGSPWWIPALLKLAEAQAYSIDDLIETFLDAGDGTDSRYQNGLIELMWLTKGDSFSLLFERLVENISSIRRHYVGNDGVYPFAFSVLNRLSPPQKEQYINSVLETENMQFFEDVTDYLTGKESGLPSFSPWFTHSDWDGIASLNLFSMSGPTNMHNPSGWRETWYEQDIYPDDRTSPIELLIRGSYHLTPDIPEAAANRLADWFLYILDKWDWSAK